VKALILITATLSLVVLLSMKGEVVEAQMGRLDFGHGIILEYQIVPFDKEVFRQKRGRIGPVYGVDGGGAPSTKLAKLVLRRGRSVTPLEVSCMYQPALAGMRESQFYVRVFNVRSMTLTGVFSDAAGTYVAQWYILDGIGVRTLLSNDQETVSRVMPMPYGPRVEGP
jgi:hypothetical protein